MRISAILVYNIFTYSNMFFLCKNALMLSLQFYRFVSLNSERKAEKKAQLQAKQKLWKQFMYLNKHVKVWPNSPKRS